MNAAALRFDGNTSGDDGAAIKALGSASILIANSAFINNDGHSVMRLERESTGKLINNTIANNVSSTAAVHISQATNSNGFELINNTITGNSNRGFQIQSSTTVDVGLYNNLITGNDAAECQVAGGVTTAQDNVFGSNGDAEGCSGFDTELNNLTPTGDVTSLLETDDNGDPVAKINSGRSETVALITGSEAVNAGNNAWLPNESDLGVDIDLDGATDDPIDEDQRATSGDRIVFGTVDAGAFEGQSNELPLVVDITEDSISEDRGVSAATVTRPLNSGSLEVTLTNGDPDDVALSSTTLTIPDGDYSIDFTVSAINDQAADGTKNVLIVATATGFELGGDFIDVTDICDSYAFPHTVSTAFTDLAADLQYAVECANANATDDVIDLDGQTISYTTAPSAYDDAGHNAFAPIESSATSGSLTIENGVIERDGSLTSCGTGDRSEFRFFRQSSAADLSLSQLTLRNGCASDGTSSSVDIDGGAIYANSGTLTLNEVVMDANTAVRIGGAIVLGGGAYAQVLNSTFNANTASSTAAISAVSADIDIVNSTFVDHVGNRAIYLQTSVSGAFINNTFVNNTASQAAILANSVTSGSGLTFTNNTIIGNSSVGIWVPSATTVDVFLYNNLIAGNDGSECTIDASTVTAKNNVFGTNNNADGCSGFASSAGNITPSGGIASLVQTDGSGDPLLADNGGTTETVALITGSVAVNAGDNTLLPNESDLGFDSDNDGMVDNPIDTDQRGTGFNRITFSTVDAGAFEGQTSELPLIVEITASSISEHDGSSTATVTRPVTAGALEITLTSSDSGEATTPSTVTIPDGDYSIGFTITAVNDTDVDGTQTVNITASASGYADGADTLDITDICASYSFPHTVSTSFTDLPTDLRYAVECANSNATDDAIDLNGQTITYTESPEAYDDNGYNALESIADSSTYGTLTITNGNIERSSSLTVCDGGTDDREEFRFLHLGASADLTLANLALRNGCSSDASGQLFDELGAAIFSLGGNLTLDTVLLQSNTAQTTAAGISAISRGSISINASQIIGNTAATGGTALVAVGSNTLSLTVTNSLFSANTGAGVLFANLDTSGALVNNTFINNTATTAAIELPSLDAGTGLQLINNTITGNSNEGLQIGSASTAAISLYNNLIAGNDGAECNNAGSNVTAQYNVFGTSSDQQGCTGFTSATNNTTPTGDLTALLATDVGSDPLLADNGGLTATVALIAGSDAINAGDNSLLPNEADLGIDIDADATDDAPIDVDQRGSGFARIALDTVDAGAYELNCAAYTSPYTLGTVLADLASDLRYAVECANSNATDDVIDLGGQTVAFFDAPAAYDEDGFNALPSIPNSTTYGSLTLQNGVIERDSSLTSCNGSGDVRTQFRLMRLNNSAEVFLSQLTLRNGCATFVNSDAKKLLGGAIYSKAANLSLDDVVMEDNNAGADGGAIYADGGILIAHASGFDRNRATSEGGAIFLDNTVFTATSSRFDGNEAVLSEGAAIYAISQLEFYLANNVFTGNQGDTVLSPGSSGSGWMLNNTIVNNTVTEATLYIRSQLSTKRFELFNNTIVGNSDTGVLVEIDAGNIDFFNNLIAGNGNDQCVITGGGFTRGGTVTAQNNVFGTNGDAGGCEDANFDSVSGNITAVGALATLIETDASGDPLLADNGGLSETVALIRGSDAINAGSNALLPNETDLGLDIDGDGMTDDPIDVDQRGNGFPRILISTVDAGAFEQQNQLPSASDVSIGGVLSLDQILVGSYSYNDTDGDPESGSSYRWQRADDNTGTNAADIGGANSTSYTTVADDTTKYLAFCVSPNDGNEAGNEVCSDWAGPISAAAILVSPTSGLSTSEQGDTANFSVVLAAQPTNDVSIALSSSDTTEGTPSPNALTFTTANWDQARAITVSGVDDTDIDGDQGYLIVLAPATSTDTSYAGYDPSDVALTNIDDNDSENADFCETTELLVPAGTYLGNSVLRSATADITTLGAVEFPTASNAVFQAATGVTFAPGLRIESGATLAVQIVLGDCSAPPATTVNHQPSTFDNSAYGNLAISQNRDDLPEALQKILGNAPAWGFNRDNQGERIVFTTDEALVGWDDNALPDVYLFDTNNHAIAPLSVTASGQVANGSSDQPRIDAHGALVVFRSDANDLINNDLNRVADIFLTNVDTNELWRVSLTEANTESPHPAAHPAIGGDDAAIFYDRANDDGWHRIYQEANGTTTISPDNCDAQHPVISTDGRYLAYICSPYSIDQCRIDVRDRVQNLTLSQKCEADLQNLFATAWQLEATFSADKLIIEWRVPEPDNASARTIQMENPWSGHTTNLQ